MLLLLCTGSLLDIKLIINFVVTAVWGLGQSRISLVVGLVGLCVILV